jgi:spermidine/putrescine ABC transporter ATP-binding subunit
MSEPRTLLAIDKVSKNFGRVTAVDGISLDIRENEFFALLGPSGCGKTTLLRMLAGFETPNEGRILLDGRDIAKTPPNRRPVNLMFQSYALFPHMSVRANVSYGLEMERLPANEIRSRVDAILATTELVAFADRKPEQLSGGQKQRVALARALVKRPRLLLLDEPLGALDKKLREEMQIELRQLQRTVGITFVFVTHDQEEALTMADRIAVMAKGKTLQIDSPARLYEAPNCREVAGFIGTMNFFHGRVTAKPHDHAIIDAGTLGRLEVGGGGKLPNIGSAITVAVRPEKLTLSQQPIEGWNAIAGRVSAQAYFGDRSHFYVRVSGVDRLIAVARQNAARSLDDPSTIGTDVWISFAPEAAILLSE